jgi:glucan phosphoethanolaminetransferase (alkaline phosphatase superfamily)
MCYSSRGFKYFLAGLLVYVVPGLVFCGFVLSTTPHYSSDYSNSMMAIVFLCVFVGTVLIFPVIVFRYAPHIVNPMIPIGLAIYFVVAYGCLVFFYLRKSKSGRATTNLDITPLCNSYFFD